MLLPHVAKWVAKIPPTMKHFEKKIDSQKIVINVGRPNIFVAIAGNYFSTNALRPSVNSCFQPSA